MAIKSVKNKLRKLLEEKQNVSLASLLVGSTLYIVALFGAFSRSWAANINLDIISWFAEARFKPITTLLSFITNVASPVNLAIFALTLSIVWAVNKKEIKRPILLAGSVGFTAILSNVLKNLFESPRPSVEFMVDPIEMGYSFPSGHVIVISVFLLVLSYLICSREMSKKMIKKYSIITIISIVLIALSRIYLGYHWLTDIIASIGLALIILSIIVLIDIKTKNKKLV